jgi:hypothetical protein
MYNLIKNVIAAPTSRLLTCYYVWYYPKTQRILDANLCTHVIIIGGMGLSANGTLIHPPINATEVRQFVTVAKSANPQLKVMISLTPDIKNITAVVCVTMLCVMKL